MISSFNLAMRNFLNRSTITSAGKGSDGAFSIASLIQMNYKLSSRQNAVLIDLLFFIFESELDRHSSSPVLPTRQHSPIFPKWCSLCNLKKTIEKEWFNVKKEWIEWNSNLLDNIQEWLKIISTTFENKTRNYLRVEKETTLIIIKKNPYSVNGYKNKGEKRKKAKTK